MKVDDVNNSDGKASLKRQKLGTIAQFFHFVAEEKKKTTKFSNGFWHVISKNSSAKQGLILTWFSQQNPLSRICSM